MGFLQKKYSIFEGSDLIFNFVDLASSSNLGSNLMMITYFSWNICLLSGIWNGWVGQIFSQTVQHRKAEKVGLASFGNAKGRVGASLKVSPLSNHVAVKNFRVWVPICKDFGWVAKQNNQNAMMSVCTTYILVHFCSQ